MNVSFDSIVDINAMYDVQANLYREHNPILFVG